jgi:rod shape determining protein RodA
LAKYLSRPETDFRRTQSQIIAAGIALLPAVFQHHAKRNRFGVSLSFHFFIVMYREGLPSAVLIIGFSAGTLVVATLLVEKNVLAIILLAITVFIIFIMRRQVKRNRSPACQYYSYRIIMYRYPAFGFLSPSNIF